MRILVTFEHKTIPLENINYFYSYFNQQAVDQHPYCVMARLKTGDDILVQKYQELSEITNAREFIDIFLVNNKNALYFTPHMYVKD